MADSKVILEEIGIKNFKNAKVGRVAFNSKKTNILGIYGRNGTGKTAIIDCVKILKLLLIGEPIPRKLEEFVRIGAEYLEIEYIFRIEAEEKTHKLGYLVRFSFNQEEEKELLIESEKISIYGEAGEELTLDSENYTQLIGKDENSYGKLKDEKIHNYKRLKSFIFSLSLIDKLWKMANQEMVVLMDRLVRYGNKEVFILDEFEGMPISIKCRGDVIKKSEIEMSKSIVLFEDELERVEEEVEKINKILKLDVPNFQIGVRESRSKGFVKQVEFVAIKDGLEIPLRYESKGIKKIISLIPYLIKSSEESSSLIAIDSLDLGIYEPLLGAGLERIDRVCKGQLIFTAENQIGLKVLDPNSIMFTSDDAENRYVHLED